VAGDAVEAFALNTHVLRDPQASDAERALALCWVMHIAGDIHQPLHTGQLFSPAYPQGDHGGSLEFVKDPLTGEPITLHWFWDDSVNRSGDPADVAARARVLEAKFPRSGLAELKSPARIADFPAWAAESHAFAVTVGYATRLETGAAATAATALPPAYVEQATRLAERRVATAGYRLADVLREAFGGR
jgi:hypothetical protein